MNKTSYILTICLLSVGVSLSCISVTSQNEINEKSNEKFVKPNVNNEKTHRQVSNVNLLCDKLHELKRMPNKSPIADDPIYDGLKEKGQEAIPCLIEKITDTTLMDDPREAPHIQDFRVGDAAVFMLHRITNEPLEEILNGDAKKQWETEGVYAYFSYVEKQKNREKIQLWWKNWLKKQT